MFHPPAEDEIKVTPHPTTLARMYMYSTISSTCSINVCMLILYIHACVYVDTKVIIATNAVESSVTIPDCDHVVCCGMAKRVKLNKQTQTSVLVKGWISKAAATQRAGRTGRTRPGTVYRLYGKRLFESGMDTFEASGMKEHPLSGICLHLLTALPAENLVHILNEVWHIYIYIYSELTTCVYVYTHIYVICMLYICICIIYTHVYIYVIYMLYIYIYIYIIYICYTYIYIYMLYMYMYNIYIYIYVICVYMYNIHIYIYIVQ